MRFFSLQTGSQARVLGQSEFAEQIVDMGGQLTDFGDTARAMAALDLIITVDTAAAHLAGGMGRPVWTLLPWVPDWRWGMDSTHSIWYPSMRLFRQERRDDWEAPMAAVAVDLARHARDFRVGNVTFGNHHD